MWKLKAVISLIFAKRYCLFTLQDRGMGYVIDRFRVMDAEEATGILLDQMKEKIDCENAVIAAKEIINK